LQKTQTAKREEVQKTKTEMADAHCHPDMFADPKVLEESVAYGVNTIIANGSSTKANLRILELSDGRHVFPVIGIDPDFVDSITEEELDFNMKMIRAHRDKVVGIGEIGLDYKETRGPDNIERQKYVFDKFLDLALELDLPVSVHARNSLEDVFSILKEKKMKKVHLHFFEGDEKQAEEVQRLGYMISVPPMQSSRRKKVIKMLPLDLIMAESDAPAAGGKPLDVEKSVNIIAEAKGLSFARAAEATTLNTKRFFNIFGKTNLMRM
jgi:TatD DNase family protein